MIKFFRRIRKELLKEGKVKSYLTYAVGEIFLVVIGILIALQINNNNERAKERKKELAFLKEINLDFKSNKAQLDSIIKYNEVSLHAGERLSKILTLFDFENPKRNESNRHVADSIGYYIDLVWRNKSFNPKNGTVEALLNSSSFDLITNDTLRRNLISWKDVLGDYLEEEQLAVKFLYEEYGPWARSTFEPDLDNDPQSVKALFSKEYRNFTYHRVGDLKNMIDTANSEGIIDMINSIIKLTETDKIDN
ncbi:DUF6090 family protein [Tenacibaculum holothuriorum]|uniref:DUF6090 family protein n=1 Tax=Tenacibaculum holothuriorum TaxID=1635173 RepID=UPI000A32898A|nr:DUF6090 family protein [Tenacibaculum holothuriorum]